MTSLIQAVKLSCHKAAVGESIRVDARTTDPTADVSVNNAAGAHHFLQFDTTGSHTIAITASVGHLRACSCQRQHMMCSWAKVYESAQVNNCEESVAQRYPRRSS
jgi:NADH dehydrogenase/NADH:ubiquinone oxidoreductase subunit G